MVLEKIYGEYQVRLFVGFSDLFQQILDALIPNLWPFSVIEDIFNNAFDKLQEQMKPFARAQGEAMGREAEAQIVATIQAKVKVATDQIEAVRVKAMSDIQTAKNELVRQADEIKNLIERVNKLEGGKKPFSFFG